ncbi:MAG: nucleotidyl transferase AbiEii/AbiGii toxin family protein [Caulobacteraceae bacterium]
MRKPPVRNLSASVRDRLLDRSRQGGEDFQFLLQRYAAERFLYRLGQSRHRDSYVLKGAMLFPVWGGSIYRATRDIDFTGYGASEPSEVIAVIRELCATPMLDDGLAFDANSVRAEPIRDDAEYGGLRVKFSARLAGSSVPMQIDIGFGNAIEPAPTDVDYPTLLDMPAPQIRAYPREAIVAEKLHAMVALGERNSRLKDFRDLYFQARQFTFEGERLARAIAATFARRRTAIEDPLPAAIAPRFYGDEARAAAWRAHLARQDDQDAPVDWVAVGELLQSFLTPPWRALARGRNFSDLWPPAGPWGPP